MRNLRGQTAVITGAASGIGRALAVELAGLGVHLALADVNAPGLDETAALSRAYGVRVFTAPLDVADRAAVFAFARDVLRECGEVHIVVNNAGVALSQTIQHLTPEDMEWIVGINFWGVVHGTQAFLPHLVGRGRGHIVNISSVFGIISVPTQGAYNATKFAVRGFTEALRQEIADTGVVAVCVHPGGIRTNIARSSRFHAGPDGSTDADRATRRFDTLARTSAEDAARTIIEGIRRDRPRVLIGADAHIIDALQRVMPERYDGFVRLISGGSAPLARRARAALGRIGRVAVAASARAVDRVPGFEAPRIRGRTLDPQVHATLAFFSRISQPSSDDDDPIAAREVFAREVDLLDSPPPSPVTTSTLILPGGAGPLRALLHRPQHAPNRAPGLVYFHGGGFVIGSPQTHATISRRLAAQTGCVVVSVDYRLGPEHRFPAAWDDAVAAFAGFIERADELGVDPARVAVAGDSAGGNLAAWIARAGREGRCPPPAVQLLLYPVLDMTGSSPSRRDFDRGFLLEGPRISWFSRNSVDRIHYRDLRASPLLAEDADLAGLAPVIVATAGFDPLVDEGDIYAERLQRAGVPTLHRRYDGLVHGFAHFPALWDAARKAMDEVSALLVRQLHG